MTDNSLVHTMRAFRTRGRRAGALALVLTAAAGAVPAAAAPTPSPSSSESALRLPVMPSQLAYRTTKCTEKSDTAVAAVPWAQQQLEISRAQQFSRGLGVTVGVVDTGVATRAPRLEGRVSAADGAGQDCVGHGTFLAGIIAAAPRDGSGFTGVAPAARIFAARATDVTGVPSAELVARGLRDAVDGGAEVVLVAAALQQDSRALDAAVKYAADHDVLMVAAAVPDETLSRTGEETSSSPSFWPASADGVLSVLDVDIDGVRADDAVTPQKAQLAAPGSGVTGIGPSGEGNYLGNGASVAAAFVAGTAALVRAYHPELSAGQVANRLMSTSYPADVPRVDVNGALTGILPAGRAAGTPSADSAIHLVPQRGDGGAVRRALLFTACCGLLALGLWGGATLLRRLRRDTGTHPGPRIP